MKREEMTELQKAKVDMDDCRRKGGIAYKQAKKHYEKALGRAVREKGRLAAQIELSAI